MIEIQHLTKTFTTAGGVTEALKDVSLTIPDGEIYGTQHHFMIMKKGTSSR